MHNTIYEQSGGSYTQVGDYLLPDLLPGTDERTVGPWGLRHLRWLRQNRRMCLNSMFVPPLLHVQYITCLPQFQVVAGTIFRPFSESGIRGIVKPQKGNTKP